MVEAYKAGAAGIPQGGPWWAENFLRTESEAGWGLGGGWGTAFVSFPTVLRSAQKVRAQGMAWPGSAVSSGDFSCTSLTLLMSARGYVC